MARKFSKSDRIRIRTLYYVEGYSGREIADMFNVCEHDIDAILGRL